MTRNRESKVEQYLDQEIRKLGGITRKWVSPGRVGVPDRIVILRGIVIFVEVKTSDGKLSDRQIREMIELESYEMKVKTVYGIAGVDDLIEDIKCQNY